MADKHKRLPRLKPDSSRVKGDPARGATDYASAGDTRPVKAGKIPKKLKAISAGGHTGKFCNIGGMAPDEWWMQLESSPDRLLELDRLVNLGLLTSSLAHEILNPLSAALNLNMLVHQMLSAKALSLERIGKMRTHLSNAVSEVSRVCRLISELRAFAQPSGSPKQVLDLNRIVESALSLASHRLKLDNVQVGTQLSSQLPRVLGDRVQLQHLVLNVIQNCAQSGKIDSLEVLTEVQGPAGKVLLEVRHGRDRISSKPSAGSREAYPDSDGSLHSSLLVASCIAQAHGGIILRDSASGGGLVYRVILPMVDPKGSKLHSQQ